MNQNKIISKSTFDTQVAALQQIITNVVDYTGAQIGSIPIFDSTNGNHLKMGKITKDANGFTIYDDANVQMFRVDSSRRLIVGDGAIGSIGLTKDGVQMLTSSGWFDVGISFYDSGWFNLTLQNGWVSYGSGYPTPQCRKSGNKVTLRGVMKNGTRTNGTLIFTLPDGFRPTAPLNFSNESSSNHAYIIISTDGQVKVYNLSDSTRCGFDGIEFYID